MANTFKFRIDHHGSLARPPQLLAARERHHAGELGADELRDLEDSAITELTKRQRNLHLSVVTDGHVRRADRFSPVVDAVDGLELRSTHRGERWIATTGELKARGALVADDVALLTAVTRTPVKVNLPAPSAMAGHLWDDEASSRAWGSPRDLGDALAEIVRNEILALVGAGVRLIQLDNHRYGAALSPGSVKAPTLSLDDAIAVDTAAVADLDRPDGTSIGICPAVELGEDVDADAAGRLFDAVPVDRWIVPFHTGSTAETALVQAVPEDRDLCLGVLDAASAELEDIDLVLSRIDDVAERRGIDGLALAPNRGFADVATEPLIRPEDQWRKLTHVETLVRMVWGNEL